MSGRTCLDCGETLKGRSDKKFCSDQCRNNWNNRINRETNELVRSVHNLLRKNRKILSDLYESGRKKIHIDVLAVTGYSFNFFTHLIEHQNGSPDRYCYEYGYREVGDDYIEILQNRSYLNL